MLSASELQCSFRCICPACQMDSAKSLYRHDAAVFYQLPGSLYRIPGNFSSLGIHKKHMRPAVRAAIRLGMVTSVFYIMIFPVTRIAHRKCGHRSLCSVVWYIPNNCKSRPAVCAVYKRISVSSVERILKLPQTIFANAYIRRNKGVSESFRFTLFYLEPIEILKLIRKIVFDLLDYCKLRSSFRKSINKLLQILFFPLKLQLDPRRSVLYKSRELQKAYLLVDKRAEPDPLNYSMNFYIRVLQGFSAPTAYFVN